MEDLGAQNAIRVISHELKEKNQLVVVLDPKELLKIQN